MRICSVDGCGKAYLAKGLCQMHYDRLKNTGAIGSPFKKRVKPKLCKVDGCRRDHSNHGYCNVHWKRIKYLGGDPGEIESRKATNGYAFHKDKNGYIHLSGGKEHILAAQKALGRPLSFPEQVHHVNRIRYDNRPANLVVCPDHAYHFLIERRGKAYDACGHADWLKCKYCKQWDDPQNMYLKPGTQYAEHRECGNLYRRNKKLNERVIKKKTCLECKGLFEEYRQPNQKFCSVKCKNDYNWRLYAASRR